MNETNVNPILSIQDLYVDYNSQSSLSLPWEKKQIINAVNGVSFNLHEGKTLGIVGETGCGKSTIAKAIIKLTPVKSGQIFWMGSNLLDLNKQQMQKIRKEIQMIFQDPLASLNPRMNIGEIISEPLRTHFPTLNNNQVKKQVKDMMMNVGLLPNLVNRYPHEFSGGQCQRIGIARALILKPKLIICDEPVSALDVSIQAQVVNLLMELQEEMGLTLIFIAHDLSIVKHISTKIMVLYLGNMVELANSNDIYENPRHPYTQALISAVPIPDPKIEKQKDLILIEGDLPSPVNPPSGCVFRTRCQKAQKICSEEKPEFIEASNSHEVACHFHD